jgi:hypothetical protein
LSVVTGIVTGFSILWAGPAAVRRPGHVKTGVFLAILTVPALTVRVASRLLYGWA